MHRFCTIIFSCFRNENSFSRKRPVQRGCLKMSILSCSEKSYKTYASVTKTHVILARGQTACVKPVATEPRTHKLTGGGRLLAGQGVVLLSHAAAERGTALASGQGMVRQGQDRGWFGMGGTGDGSTWAGQGDTRLCYLMGSGMGSGAGDGTEERRPPLPLVIPPVVAGRSGCL